MPGDGMGVPKGRGHVLALRAALVAVLTLGQMKLVRGKTRVALGRRRVRESQRGLPRHPHVHGGVGRAEHRLAGCSHPVANHRTM